MRLTSLRPLLLAAAVFFCGATALARSAGAQQRPTPQQIQDSIRRNPGLLQQLQQQLKSSGLTTEQIRARLRAQGYPDSMLDAYLPGGTPSAGPDTASTAQVLEAVQALGIADSTDLVTLRAAAGLSDSTDTLRTARDSLS